MSETPTPEESSAVAAKGDAMSDIARWAIFDGGIGLHPYGKWVLYDDHQAEVERLTEQVGALTLALEQADEMKAHAEASAAAEEAETDRVTAERDEAQAEVERLRTTLAWADATIYRLQAERLQTLLTVERGERRPR